MNKIYIPKSNLKFTKVIRKMKELPLETGAHVFGQEAPDIFRFICRTGDVESQVLIARFFPNEIVITQTEGLPTYGAIRFLEIVFGVEFIEEGEPDFEKILGECPPPTVEVN